MSTGAAGSAVVVAVAPASDRYDSDDERWLAQVSDLHADLRREVDGFEVQSSLAAGTKGAVDTVVVALGSAGAFSAAVSCLKAWLARDKARRVVLTWTQDGQQQQAVLEGDNIDVTSLRRLVEAISARVSGS